MPTNERGGRVRDLLEYVKQHTGWTDVVEDNGIIVISFSQNERMHLRNVQTSGKYTTSPTLSMEGDAAPSRTFFLAENGIDGAVYEELMRVPILFKVHGTMEKGIVAEYEHWTLNSFLHRTDGPAYTAWYVDHGGQKDRTEMHYQGGLLHREVGPAITIYKNLVEEPYSEGDGTIRQFDYLIMECRHYSEEMHRTISWPFVQRMTHWYGRQLYVDDSLRQTAAKKTSAKWMLPEGMGSGIYPVTLDMEKFHEWTNEDKVESRVVQGTFTSRWIKIDGDDRRPLTWSDMRRNSIHHSGFDQDFRPLVSKIGLVDKPFYEDAEVEFAVLTDLEKHIEARRD